MVESEPMLTPYIPGIDSDLLVLSWYHTMATCEDFERGFSVELAPVGAFMAAMRQCDLLYVADDQGIWFAAWFEPKMTGAFYGLWIRKDKRHNLDSQQLVLDSLAHGFARGYRVLILATLHQRVIDQGERFGFVTMGTIPHLFDGEPAHIAWLDENRFEAVVEFYEDQAHATKQELH